MMKELYNTLERPYAIKYGYLVQKILLISVLLNIFAFALSLINIFPKLENILLLIEDITVVIFIIELLLRYISIGYDDKYKGLLGRVKYTFTPYILIDIISLIPLLLTSISTDVLLLRIIRFFKFFRVLRLIRMKKVIKKFFTINAFASSRAYIQVIILFIISLLVIFLFSNVYNSFSTSLNIFMSPTSILETKTGIQSFLGIIELLIGLIVGGALISIITSTLVNITDMIKKGYMPYKDNGHIVIINSNSKLNFILEEINNYYAKSSSEEDVIIFLPNNNKVEAFRNNLSKKSNLNLTIITGEELNWNSFERININRAKKVLLLNDNNAIIKSQTLKMTKYILSNPLFDNKELEFIIETNSRHYPNEIYTHMFTSVENNYQLLDDEEIINDFLNRSIVNFNYFSIYSELLSFTGFSFHEIKSSEYFNTTLCFSKAYMAISNGVLVGVIQNNEINLNPNENLEIQLEDKLLLIIENDYSVEVNTQDIVEKPTLIIDSPKTKLEKKLCLIGDNKDIELNEINKFIDESSIENFTHICSDKIDFNYLSCHLWNEILEYNYDAIILNLEDEYEFKLTLHLRSKYRDNPEFLSKIVNIIHEPVNAELLKEKNNSFIISERLVGGYIAQMFFNKNMAKIFNEITSQYGDELYELTREEYPELFELTYNELKFVLINNKMIYLGAFVDGDFIFDCKEIHKIGSIGVLTEGY